MCTSMIKQLVIMAIIAYIIQGLKIRSADTP